MSERDGPPEPDHDDPADAPFADDAERAEAHWLLARENDPDAPAPSSQLASEYAELENVLGNLPVAAIDDSWQARVWDKIAPRPQPGWRRLLESSLAVWQRRTTRWVAGAGVATVIAVALVIWLRPGAELEVELRRIATARGGPEEAVVGDQLVVTARPRGAGELRVYRRGALLARCPRGPGCTASSDGEHMLEVGLDAPARYHVVLVVGTGDPVVEVSGPAAASENPASETMDAYLDRARAANVRITLREVAVH